MEEIGDELIEEVKADPLVQRRLEEIDLHERLSLRELQEHEGWRLQKERFAQFRDLAMQKLSTRLLAGEEVSRREIAFQRGYAAAIKDIFNWPERVEQDLGNAAMRAWERALQGDPDRQPNPDSPGR